MSEAVSINPVTGHVLKIYQRHSSDRVSEFLKAAKESFEEWRFFSFQQRAVFIKNAARLLLENKEVYASLITHEMGKNYSAAIAEIEKSAWVLNYFADNAEIFLQKEFIKTQALQSYVTFNPLGVILAIMPWNFPFYQVIRFAAPALMAGNTAILKHASNVQGCAFAIEDLFLSAGIPVGVFTNINVEGNAVASIIENKTIAAVTLTGSENAGREVATVAGKNLKKCVMELGGSDAYIIADDVNIDKAVHLCVKARLQNNGQTCIAAKRFIVFENIYDEFVEKFTAAMAKAQMGDPFDANTDYGPMARFDLRDELHQQVLKSINQGAVLKTGGFVPKMDGAYYPATVLVNSKPGITVFDEEIFGPVAAVCKAKNEQEAIRLANNTCYGLGAAIITSNLENANHIAADNIDAGSVFVNAMVVSDPRLPFGGIKNSGFGRELSSYGIKEFVNIKTIWIQEAL